MTLASDGEDRAADYRIKGLSLRIRTVGAPTEHLPELRKKKHLFYQSSVLKKMWEENTEQRDTGTAVRLVVSSIFLVFTCFLFVAVFKEYFSKKAFSARSLHVLPEHLWVLFRFCFWTMGGVQSNWLLYIGSLCMVVCPACLCVALRWTGNLLTT